MVISNLSNDCVDMMTEYSYSYLIAFKFSSSLRKLNGKGQFPLWQKAKRAVSCRSKLRGCIYKWLNTVNNAKKTLQYLKLVLKGVGSRARFGASGRVQGLYLWRKTERQSPGNAGELAKLWALIYDETCKYLQMALGAH